MMKKPTLLEPAVLSVFQLAIAVQLVFNLLIFLPLLLRAEAHLGVRLAIRIGLQAILLLYLNVPERIQKAIPYYLPIAILVASLEILVGQVIALTLNPPEATSIGETLSMESGGIVLVLLLPVVIVAWQYRFRTFLLFCIATTLVPLIVYSVAFGPSVLQGNFIMEFTIFRTLIYLIMGYLIVRLVDGQRQQQQALAQANKKLAQYAATLEQLTLVRERSRLARELHDTLAHAQSGIAVQLEGVDALWDDDSPRARDMLHRATASIRASMEDTRRALQALRASPLEEYGLLMALQELAVQSQQQGKFVVNLNLPINLHDHLLGLESEVEQTIYRVAQEALLNAARHSQASHVSLTLVQEEQLLILSISDNGRGFDMTSSPEGRHFGIKGMQERVELTNGKLSILSSPNKGTIVRLAIEV